MLGLFVIGFLILKLLGNRPAAPADYQQTGGAIEKKYMENGPYDVSIYESAVLQEFGKLLVYYPTALEAESEKYPVIVMCNGSGTPLSKYPAMAKHLASWGFLVIGTEKDLMARRRNTAHDEVLYSANGYVTAWFLWLLQGDEYAAGTFTGEHPEIQDNSLYQNQHLDLP